MSQAMGSTPRERNSRKIAGGMNPATPTQCQPNFESFSSISVSSGMRSGEMPVALRPSRYLGWACCAKKAMEIFMMKRQAAWSMGV